MALRMGALYDALIAAKVDEEQARRAAEEVADYNARIGNIERDLTLLKWMVSTNVILTVGVLGRLLFIR
jgi:hypothetical protein